MTKPTDYVVDNASGSDVRDDLNDLFEAIRTNNGYGSEPTTKYKYMWYANEASGSDKMGFYKANESDRIEFISLSNGNFFSPDGSVSIPSYTFTNSPTTGFYQSTTNQIGVTNNSVNTALFKATGTEIKGKLEVAPTSGDAAVDIKTVGNANDSAVNLIADTTYTTGGLSINRLQTANGKSQIIHRGTGEFEINAQESGDISLKTTNTARWKVTADGAFVAASHTATLGGADTTGAIVARGIATKAGSAVDAVTTGNLYNFAWSSPNLTAYVDTSAIGVAATNASDYRIKQNIALQTESGINKVKLLKPSTFQFKDYQGVFKADGITREGFIAHEVQEVIPSGATGTKDGTDIQSLKLDAIVSVLTKALQEAVAKIETLETKVAALESN